MMTSDCDDVRRACCGIRTHNTQRTSDQSQGKRLPLWIFKCGLPGVTGTANVSVSGSFQMCATPESAPLVLKAEVERKPCPTSPKRSDIPKRLRSNHVSRASTATGLRNALARNQKCTAPVGAKSFQIGWVGACCKLVTWVAARSEQHPQHTSKPASMCVVITG